MRSGDQVEYARHPVSWQDDGTHVPIEHEDWAPAEVLAVVEHPSYEGEPADTVAHLQPDDGPPLHLNVKLCRSV